MIPGGSQPRLSSEWLTCKYCGRPAYRSLYCSWRCATRGLGPLYLVAGALWALAILGYLLMT